VQDPGADFCEKRRPRAVNRAFGVWCAGFLTNLMDWMNWRSLNVRYKIKGEKGTHYLHTLNGTAIAISRAFWLPFWNSANNQTAPSVSRKCCKRLSAKR